MKDNFHLYRFTTSESIVKKVFWGYFIDSHCILYRRRLYPTVQNVQSFTWRRWRLRCSANCLSASRSQWFTCTPVNCFRQKFATSVLGRHPCVLALAAWQLPMSADLWLVSVSVRRKEEKVKNWKKKHQVL